MPVTRRTARSTVLLSMGSTRPGACHGLLCMLLMVVCDIVNIDSHYRPPFNKGFRLMLTVEFIRPGFIAGAIQCLVETNAA